MMTGQVIASAIAIGLVLLTFYWASMTVETQLQASEFTSAIYSFQILANFDDGAFKTGDVNYALLSISRGRIENEDYNLHVQIVLDYDLIYDQVFTTKVISYRGGWLVSTPKNFYRGDDSPVTNTSLTFVVYTEMKDGARVFLKPRVKVFPLGVYKGHRVNGEEYNVYMLNIYIPRIVIGECYGTSPYHLILRTNKTQVITLQRNFASTSVHTIRIYVNGGEVTISTEPIDMIIITIVTSEIAFEVKGV